MPYIIGTDEAGYGPNLGPLVIGATLWKVPDVARCLYDTLSNAICRPGESANEPNGNPCPDKKFKRLVIGDSKAVYKSKGSIKRLERSVLAMLGLSNPTPKSPSELLELTANLRPAELDQQNTYRWSSVSVPLDHTVEQLSESIQYARSAMGDSESKCVKMGASVIFPEQFNQGLLQFGNKSNLLGAETCKLAKRLLQSVPADEETEVLFQFDRLGGRSRYAGLLQQELTNQFIAVNREDKNVSSYQWSDNNLKATARFIVKGESQMPIALSSMLAKYLREISMKAWNHFWIDHIPTIRPTAGYPQDAKRFKREISATQQRLQLNDSTVWRNR